MKREHGFTTIQLMVAVVAFALICFVFGLTAYGLYLAFSASVILGVLVFIIEPLPLLIGVLAWCGRPDVCHQLVTWLKLPQ